MSAQPADIVDQYLQLCEDRQVAAAAKYLADGARLEFPGGALYRSLEELVEAPKAYRWVRKNRDRYVVGQESGRTVVTSMGRLYGERLDGSPFEGIRYVDVFVFDGDHIAEQIVWNDLSEHGFTTSKAHPAKN